ncbi:MAG: hypothetical protein ACK40T_01580 [Akkermansiaceae bacterium]|jgi:hypothetical protein
MISKRSFLCRLCLVVLLAISATITHAQTDPAGAEIGTINVTVYYATNGDPTAAGQRAEKVSEKTKTKLSAAKSLQFKHYRYLASESKAVFKSYENWSQPLKPSDEVLVRFETRLAPTKNEIPLSIDLWLSRKKVLKSDVTIKSGQPLYILGPEWRGGRLIIAVELISQKS